MIVTSEHIFEGETYRGELYGWLDYNIREKRIDIYALTDYSESDDAIKSIYKLVVPASTGIIITVHRISETLKYLDSEAGAETVANICIALDCTPCYTLSSRAESLSR